MPTPQELEERFWKKLDSDRTVMLSLADDADEGARPMTALAENHRGPLWFFTSNETSLVRALGTGARRAACAFASKDHELFASVEGSLQLDLDRAVIDRLWNPFIAAWYEHGQDDPKLALLRLDAEHAKVWLDESGLFAGIRMLLGADPKKDYRDKVAEVDLR